MGREETLACVYGEFMDLLACLSISNGAKQKQKKTNVAMEDFIAMR